MINISGKDKSKTTKMRRQKGPLVLILVSLVIVVLVFCGFLLLKDKIDQIEYKDAYIGNQVYILEVANTEGARQKGLSERDSLAKNKGMLFDYKTDGNWRIWMLKMRFNIDIAWLDKNGKVVHIKTNATPGSYPEAYYAEQPSRYVVEVPANTFESLGVKVGDLIKIN